MKLVHSDGTAAVDDLRVRIELTKHKFRFGVGMGQSWAMYDRPNFGRYRHHMAEVFNTVALGFHWGWMERVQGRLRRVEHTESNLRWAKEMGMNVKGTPLLWHNVVPKWLNKIRDLNEVERLIGNRIQNLLTRYPEIGEWGAYNEPTGAVKMHVKENSIVRWVKHKGSPTAAQAWVLKTAQAVAPRNRYINNHYTHRDPAFKELNGRLIRDGARFAAIGIQTHMHIRRNRLTEKQLWGLLEDYKVFGKPIHLTEVTVLSSEPFRNFKELRNHERAIREAGRGNDWFAVARKSKPELDQYQAAYLRDFYTLAFSHPSVETIIYWNGSDLFAWRGSAGGLLDLQHKPKPAYRTIKALIKDTWHTELETRTNASGELTFRGFFGTYKGRSGAQRKEIHIRI